MKASVFRRWLVIWAHSLVQTTRLTGGHDYSLLLNRIHIQLMRWLYFLYLIKITVSKLKMVLISNTLVFLESFIFV